MSKRSLFLLINMLLLAALACSFPGLGPSPSPAEETAETEALVSPTPLPPLPPTLIETNPPQGVELSIQGAITLFFDQTMDRTSVEAALRFEPPVESQLDWLDDMTLRIQPTESLQRDRIYQMNIMVEARSAAGLALTEQISIEFRTVGNLEVSQVLPESWTSRKAGRSCRDHR